MTKANKSVGFPTGAKRDNNGNITHILFERRARAVPINRVISFIQKGHTQGLELFQNDNGAQEIRGKVEHDKAIDLEELPEE